MGEAGEWEREREEGASWALGSSQGPRPESRGPEAAGGEDGGAALQLQGPAVTLRNRAQH